MGESALRAVPMLAPGTHAQLEIAARCHGYKVSSFRHERYLGPYSSALPARPQHDAPRQGAPSHSCEIVPATNSVKGTAAPTVNQLGDTVAYGTQANGDCGS